MIYALYIIIIIVLIILSASLMICAFKLMRSGTDVYPEVDLEYRLNADIAALDNELKQLNQVEAFFGIQDDMRDKIWQHQASIFELPDEH